MQGQFGKDSFTVQTKDGTLVAAKWLSDGLGNYVMDPQTDQPFMVPADYDMKASIEHFKKVREDYDASSLSFRNSLYSVVYETFRQSGVGDLQRSYNGASHTTGDGFVPSFTNAASFNFGLISTVLGLTETEIIGGGGLYNLYKSFRPGGQNIKTEGELWNNEPNVISIKTGMSIIHPDRDGQPLIDQGGPAWTPPASLLNIEINPDPQASHQIQLENQRTRDAANGYIVNGATNKIFALDGILNKTDFTSTQMASLASGGIRPGEMDRTTGMLVIDDGSGQIKDVSQMFSEYYGGKVGVNGAAGEAKFKDGFAALARRRERGEKGGRFIFRMVLFSKNKSVPFSVEASPRLYLLNSY
jgi:hypothetical protein